jgi:hypothetical protein
MTVEVDEARLAKEFDALMARASITIPPERRADLLIAFADLRTEIARLHAALPVTCEPAAVYRLETLQ